MNTKWGKYKLKDLFEIQGTRSLDRNKVKFVDDGINFVGRSFENNGIQGKIPKQSFEPNKPYTITATVVGKKYVKYQTAPYYCSQNINKLTPKSIFTKWNEKIANFMVTNIQKFVSMYDGQWGGYKLDDLKNNEVSLPIKGNNIDFDFIEDFVDKIEEHYQQELRNYLKITGLDNYQLTNEDRKVLAYKPKFVDFRLISIFDVFNTKSILKSQVAKLPEGTTPYLTASSQNNAVEGYISCPKEWIDDGNCVFIGGKTMVVTYQAEDFCSNDSHNLALHLKEKKYRNSLVQLYLVGAVSKALSKKYTWGSSISKSKIHDDIISLPVIDQSQKIDFDYMEKYIRAIQKMTIKAVVEYEGKISKSKQFINAML